MEQINIPGFGSGSVENDIYTFDDLPNAKFKRVGEAFQPVLDGLCVGQEVWCEIRQQNGVIANIAQDRTYPVNIKFSDYSDRYTYDGRAYQHFKPSLRPLQKFNVGQRVKDGLGKQGIVISNTFKSEFPIMVQWDGDFYGSSTDSYDTFTIEGHYYNNGNSSSVQNISHA